MEQPLEELIRNLKAHFSRWTGLYSFTIKLMKSRHADAQPA